MLFEQFIYWAFLSVISGSIIYAVTVLNKLNNSINSLNINVKELVIKNGYHEKEIADIKDEVREIRRIQNIYPHVSTLVDN